MTGTSIVTQNVTTFIKNSANFEKYFLPGVVAFEDFRKASFLISASHTSVLFCPQLFIPQQQETCQDAWLLGCPDARMKCAESGIFILKLDMNFDYLFRSSYMPV